MPHRKGSSSSLSRWFYDAFFSPWLELRIRLFHVLAMGGTLISFSVFVLGIVNRAGTVNAIATAVSTALSFSLLMYSQRSGRYQLCYMVTVMGIFIGLFTTLFFSADGYRAGMPLYFLFAVVFTIFMLEGKKAIFFSVVEVLLYVSLCILAYLRPELVNHYASEREIVTNVIINFLLVSVVLGICLYLHFRMYNEQQRRLDEQNAVLEQANRTKTEFLANASHEMRTPLTVTSVNVQTVIEILEDMGERVDDPEAEELLKNAQGEIMRLSRMVGGMLTLASMSESTDRQKLDFSSLVQSSVEMLRLNLSKRGNTMETDIEAGLDVFGNADLLAQVLTNLLQNAGTHTENGTVAVSAKRKGSTITVTVRDTGVGIAPELLPRVFERGVSTGGTGFGLYLCKTVVESHGGRIWVDSEVGKGAAVHYTLPFYEGQLGGTE